MCLRRRRPKRGRRSGLASTSWLPRRPDQARLWPPFSPRSTASCGKGSKEVSRMRRKLSMSRPSRRYRTTSRKTSKNHSPVSARPCENTACPMSNPYLGAHGRYAAGRSHKDAPAPASYPRHHAGVALHPADVGVRPHDVGVDPDRDRRRDPRPGAKQTRRASCAVPRALVGPLRRSLAAGGSLGDAESRSRTSRIF